MGSLESPGNPQHTNRRQTSQHGQHNNRLAAAASLIAACTMLGTTMAIPAATATAAPTAPAAATSAPTQLTVGPGNDANGKTGLQLSDNYLKNNGNATTKSTAKPQDDGETPAPTKTRRDAEYDYDGGTTAQYDYKDATRDYVYIDTGIDSDKDGQTDLVRADFIRPSDAQLNGKKIPSIMDASPYYGALQAKQYEDMNDPANSKQTVFGGKFDNFFVPRGYAWIMLDITGTALSQGCTDIEGPNDVASEKAVVDWLNGRTKGYRSLTDRSAGDEEKATWSSGKIGAIGGSYDGAAANALAATGVDGLTTIVPQESISSQYEWYRNNGARLANWWEPDAFANSLVTDAKQNAQCAASGHWDSMNKGADAASRNYNDFWAERNYEDKVKDFKASVFVIQGVNDLNTKMNNVDNYWALLQKYKVPSKIWVTQDGHDNPSYYRHDVWWSTIHKWFDYWLYGVKNGIMDEPQASVESADGTWKDYQSWPTPDAKNVTLTLGAAADGSTSGTLGTTAAAGSAASTEESFKGYSVDEGTADESTDQLGRTLDDAKAIPAEDRLAYLTEPLTADAHISGTPKLSLKVKASAADTNLSFALVDYGKGTRITPTPALSSVEYDSNNLLCVGGVGQYDDGCSPTGSERKVTSDAYVITRGYVNTAHKDSLTKLTPTAVNEYYPISWDAYATDYTVPAGHRLGLVIFNTSSRLAETALSDFTVKTADARLTLPLGTSATAAAPTGVSATSKPVRGGGDVTVTWATSAGDDPLVAVTGYEVRLDGGAADGKTLTVKTDGDTLTATFKGVPAGSYEVTVRALTDGDSASAWSAAGAVTVTAAAETKPGAGAGSGAGSGAGAAGNAGSGTTKPAANHQAGGVNGVARTGASVAAVVAVMAAMLMGGAVALRGVRERGRITRK
ncbi:CocE/NonD family hydrolase [Bifidobacterium leontopitheci]|uniref:Xaa-Pro dipeptidyl-peptidase n=1 Tax=Bifidobacterium leontopitheci TaxID=2650774 RepID=A0A6I1GF14_9BIFI|nr:CocE/NonD family hydrolase [Bifidobacterium leontopitheci]KAB7790135.1 X-Pro dipeptidyl-peptidase (S15 family) [Bifidobacterium leontopitheci]